MTYREKLVQACTAKTALELLEELVTLRMRIPQLEAEKAELSRQLEQVRAKLRLTQ